MPIKAPPTRWIAPGGAYLGVASDLTDFRVYTARRTGLLPWVLRSDVTRIEIHRRYSLEAMLASRATENRGSIHLITNQHAWVRQAPLRSSRCLWVRGNSSLKSTSLLSNAKASVTMRTCRVLTPIKDEFSFNQSHPLHTDGNPLARSMYTLYPETGSCSWTVPRSSEKYNSASLTCRTAETWCSDSLLWPKVFHSVGLSSISVSQRRLVMLSVVFRGGDTVSLRSCGAAINLNRRCVTPDRKESAERASFLPWFRFEPFVAP